MAEHKRRIERLEERVNDLRDLLAALLRELKHRDLRPPRLVVGDGHLGTWDAPTAVFPLVRQQRYWNHRLLNVLDKLPKRLQAGGRRLLTAIPDADTREDAERQKRGFQAWCLGSDILPRAPWLPISPAGRLLTAVRLARSRCPPARRRAPSP